MATFQKKLEKFIKKNYAETNLSNELCIKIFLSIFRDKLTLETIKQKLQEEGFEDSKIQTAYYCMKEFEKKQKRIFIINIIVYGWILLIALLGIKANYSNNVGQDPLYFLLLILSLLKILSSIFSYTKFKRGVL